MEASKNSEQEKDLIKDIAMHRVIKGLPPTGELFALRSEAEIKELINKLEESAKILTKELENSNQTEQEKQES